MVTRRFHGPEEKLFTITSRLVREDIPRGRASQQVSIPGLLALLLLTVPLASCASNGLGTPSGRPEVVVPGTPVEQVKDALIAGMMDSGYSIREVSDHKLVFGREGHFDKNLFFGSTYDPTTELQVSYDVFETYEGVRVMAAMHAVTNPGRDFERRSDLSNSKEAREFQSWLEERRDELVARSGYSPH
jgi:hypothetical protein